MATRNVIVEYRADPELDRQATSAARPLDAGPLSHLLEIDSVDFDHQFAPVRLSGMVPRERTNELEPAVRLDPSPDNATYLLRAEAEEAQVEALRAHDAVVGVFSDPRIETCLTCIGSPALGTDADVERLLEVAEMRACGMDGTGVMVAIVDTGVNVEHLEAHGKTPLFSQEKSWAWQPGAPVGAMPVGHGTMCAFDACIAAPKCTLLDVPILRPIPGGLGGLLSEAVRAYSHLQGLLTGPAPADPQPADPLAADSPPALVVSNSWGMFHPSWDPLPPGDPGNYSDNPNHPFNRSIAALEALGADILFAAGNCGPQCPDNRCQNVSTNAIYGASSHPQVLSVAGVDTAGARVGYSTVGPGRIEDRKPDLCGYTHFKGSGVSPVDGGTSAATPVIAGVIAAVRSKRPFDPDVASTSPAGIRSLLTSTAKDAGPAGYDYEHGYGVVDGARVHAEVCEEGQQPSVEEPAESEYAEPGSWGDPVAPET